MSKKKKKRSEKQKGNSRKQKELLQKGRFLEQSGISWKVEEYIDFRRKHFSKFISLSAVVIFWMNKISEIFLGALLPHESVRYPYP